MNDAAAVDLGFDRARLEDVPIGALVIVPDERELCEYLEGAAVLSHADVRPLPATLLSGNGALVVRHLIPAPQDGRQRRDVADGLVSLRIESGHNLGIAELRSASTTAWFVDQVSRGGLAHSRVGVALVHARSRRVVAANRSFCEYLGLPTNDVVGSAFGDDTATQIHPAVPDALAALLANETGAFAGNSVDAGRSDAGFVVARFGHHEAPPTYFAVYLGIADLRGELEAPPVGPAAARALPDRPLVAAVVDEHWHLRLVAPHAPALGGTRSLGQSVLPLVHPEDLPELLDTGRRVRSGELEQAPVALRVRGPGEQWSLLEADLSRLSGGVHGSWIGFCIEPAPEHLVSAAPSPRAGSVDWAELLARLRPELSAKEREVAAALLEGYRVSTIAREMFLSPSTVRNHLSSIFHKVGVASQAELVERLHAMGDEESDSPPA